MGFLGLFKSNFTRIAENTTKYYLELTRNYGNRFDDEVALLTTVGALDAQTYVFVEGSIDLDTISYIAKQAVSKEELELLGFDLYLMRLSVGIEPVDKIIRSLENGLKNLE